eukprot:TRINITY_DN66836_c1_g1_i2.p1 TRINITY_DN66836_c1_g1~~TRINITY_DN66836_c1_g1_i2.p1  ORF type:complete len:150 (+),score=17.12 TRINITY_DN66836_c1_g1_i2:40-489(+)
MMMMMMMFGKRKRNHHLHGVLLCPLGGGLDGTSLVRLPVVGDLVVERVVRVGRLQQELDGEADLVDLQRRRPLVLEDVQADAAELVDVGVVDLGQEAHLGRHHWVVVAQIQLEFEQTTLVRGALRARDHHVKVAQVVLVRRRADAYDES